MLGLVNYLLQIDRKTWDAFRARLKKDGLKVGDGLRALIKRYIEHGLEDSSRKDK